MKTINLIISLIALSFALGCTVVPSDLGGKILIKDNQSITLVNQNSDQELIHKMGESSTLRDQFVWFASRTIQMYQGQKKCVDILGAQNLLIVRKGKSMELRLIDYGILDLQVLEKVSPGTLIRLAERISRLQFLLDSVNGPTGKHRT